MAVFIKASTSDGRKYSLAPKFGCLMGGGLRDFAEKEPGAVVGGNRRFVRRSAASKKLSCQAGTREREYLRTSEVKEMIRAAKKVGRHGIRDGGIILLMFRHGLRTAELVALRWTQIDLAGGYIEVHRVKHGRDSIHLLRSPELRALRQIQRDYADTSNAELYYCACSIRLK